MSKGFSNLNILAGHVCQIVCVGIDTLRVICFQQLNVHAKFVVLLS